MDVRGGSSERRTELGELPVVILCGGYGTRLREVTERIPKPLVDIGGKPILWHIMKLYSHYGVRRFILCLGYKSSMIKEYFLRYREYMCDFTMVMNGEHELRFHNDVADEHWEITFAETGLTAGTGNRLYRIRPYIDTDTFMFTYGDGIGEVDIAALATFHGWHDRLGTVTGVHPGSRYGEMRVEDREVLEFNEKPTRPPGYVSGGFFVFDQRIFNYLTPNLDLYLEQEPLQKLARDGELAMFRHDGFWMGMDTYRDYQALNRMWDEDRAVWKVWS